MYLRLYKENSMSGNGKSCDECGRGPCGPSSKDIDSSVFWVSQGKCPDCRGAGDVGGYREMFSPKRVQWCSITC